MTTDPKKSLTPASISELAKSDIDQFLQTGLADFSLRELLGLLISTAGAAERSVYLEKEPTDKPIVPFSWEPFLSNFACPALEPESSGRRLCLRAIVAVTAKKYSRCCWHCSARAARSMQPKTHFRRWACPALNRIWNGWRRG